MEANYFQSSGIRFLTMEDAKACMMGDFTKAIKPGHPLYETAPYELGLYTSHASFKRLIPANPSPVQQLSEPGVYLPTTQPKEPLKGHEIL